MSPTCVIGIDLGGTNCRAGVVNAEGEVLTQVMRPVGHHRTADTLLEFLVSLIEELQVSRTTSHQPRATAVGVGAPGIIRQPDGVIERAPHFPQLQHMSLGAVLQTRIDLPVRVDNDANVVAVGEGWCGAAAQWKNFLMLTFGTGIGGAIVIEKKIFHGDAGFAGEVGHSIIQFDGPPCPCGGSGCWERYASASGLHHLIETSHDPTRGAFLQLFGGEVDRVDPAAVYRLAKEGNIYAGTLWKKFGAYVGAGIASLVNIIGIHQVVIGGGLAGAWDFFIGETERTIRKRTYQETAAAIVLKQSILGDASGIIGAARLVLG